MGMEAFAERARRELIATGEKVRRRVAETRDRADGAGAPDRRAGPRRAVERRDRRPAVPQPAHRRVASAQRVRQARDQLAPGPPRRPAEARGRADARLAGCRTAAPCAPGEHASPPGPTRPGPRARSCSTGCWRPRVAGRAPHSCSAARRGSARPRCCDYCARRASGFRVARRRGRVGDGAAVRRPAPAVRVRCSNGSSACRRPSAMRLRWPSVWPRGASGSVPGRPGGPQPAVGGRRASGRCCASSTTRSGSTRRRRRCSASSPGGCRPSRWCWCSPSREPARRARARRTARACARRARPTTTRGRCWPRLSPGGSTSGCATGSSPRRAAIRSRCSSCPAA